MSATIGMLWDCEQGCPPVHFTVPVEIDRDASGPGLTLIASTAHGERLLELGVAAHMAGSH